MRDRFFTPSTLVFLTAVSILSGCQSEAEVFEPRTLRPVQVLELATSQSRYTEQFSGKVYSQHTADLAFRVPGHINEILVKPGDIVTKGQVLAKIDTHDFEVSKKELQARLKEATAAHALAKSELRRVQRAVSDDAISSVTLDRAQSGYERSKAAIEVVEQNLQKVEDSINYATLKAPFSGTVANIRFDAFEQVQAGISVLTLHQPEMLEVRVEVPETLIHHFSNNLLGDVSWYGSEAPISAYVSDIETQPDLLKQTYSVNYTVTGKAGEDLFPGKHVMVTSHFVMSNQDFCIPYSAIIGKDGNSYVYVADEQVLGNFAQKQSVHINYLEGDNACVTGELNIGDKVVVSGAHYLSDGMQVGAVAVRNREGV